MSTPATISVESFLAEITGPDGVINLSTLTSFNGGGTHAIYRSDKCPGLLLKVMHRTVGKERAELSQHLEQLTKQYAALYDTFGELRCIIETRSIQSIKASDTAHPQETIVSVVPFDPCFQSEEKFGFNVESEELSESLIDSKRYLYGVATRSLLGSHEKPSPYVIKNYPLLNKNFEQIFRRLDSEPSLVVAMREFLNQYKLFYKQEGILLDTIGFDNVLFYNTTAGWQFKLGSVIKHDTRALTKKVLEEILHDPTVVKESFEYFTSVYFMPACIRALNACAEKVGIDKIIDDIVIDEKTIDALATIHRQMEMNQRAFSCAKHGDFSRALKLYHQYQSDEKVDATETSDFMGTLYWDFIKNGGQASSRSEVEAYLMILRDERNAFPEDRQKIVGEAIEGLANKLLVLDSKGPAAPLETACAGATRYRYFGEPAPSVTTKEGLVTGNVVPPPLKTIPK
ncbi:MAG: hypothetical protein NTW08_00750 [Gammaproteobacteria bacterium]|nr:hypothetical protein [Gammaproteobacteria bacterium]